MLLGFETFFLFMHLLVLCKSRKVHFVCFDSQYANKIRYDHPLRHLLSLNALFHRFFTVKAFL